MKYWKDVPGSLSACCSTQKKRMHYRPSIKLLISLTQLIGKSIEF